MRRVRCVIECPACSIDSVLRCVRDFGGDWEEPTEVPEIPDPDKTDVEHAAPTIPCAAIPAFAANAEIGTSEWDVAVEERLDVALAGAGLEVAQQERAARDQLSRDMGTSDIWDGCEESPPIEDVLRCMAEEFETEPEGAPMEVEDDEDD